VRRGLSPSNPPFILLFIQKVSNHDRVHVGGDKELLKKKKKKKKTKKQKQKKPTQEYFALRLDYLLPGFQAWPR
jgi:hypothetical protein